MTTAQTVLEPPKSACPELEALAAFLDGQLAGGEREAVVEHLASCEDCYDVYAEALRVQEDLGEDLGPRVVLLETKDGAPDELAPVVRHPRSFGWGWRAAAAMAAALVLAVGLVWLGSRPRVIPVADVSVLLAAPDAPALLAMEWYEHGWPRTRGMAPVLGQTERDDARRAFRLGVHSVDLETAFLLGDDDQATIQTHQMERLVAQLDLPQLWIAMCRELRDKIESGAARDEISALGKSLEKQLTEGDYPRVDPFYFSFGKWVETSRLAALTGSGDYFAGRDFRRYLSHLEEKGLQEEVSRHVGQIRVLVEAGEVVPQELVGDLEEIIRLEGVR